MTKESVQEILTTYKIVAIVGLSRDPSKDSYRVAAYLKNNGYTIIPVNPTATEILDEKSHKSLLDIPSRLQKTVEVVDIFRPSEEVPQIVDQATGMREKYGRPFVVWMQLGIVNEQAAANARATGLIVIMDRCMMQEHRKMVQAR